MRKALATLVATCAAGVLTAAPAVAAPVHSHLGGRDRYETAVVLSQETAPLNRDGRCSDVNLVSGTRFPDAVSASSDGVNNFRRVLLTERDFVPQATQDELRRLFRETGCVSVYVVGGGSVIGAGAYADLDRLTAEIDDIVHFGYEEAGGADRYETNLTMAMRFGNWNALAQGQDAYPTAAFVATGENYPDALAAAGYVNLINGPVLFTPTAAMYPDTLDELSGAGSAQDGWLTHIDTFYIVGGATSVSENVAAQLRALRPGVTVERIAGGSRYETSTKLVQRFAPDADSLTVTTGNNFPDALAAAPQAARRNSVLVLSDGNNPTPALQTELQRHEYPQITTIGTANTGAIG